MVGGCHSPHWSHIPQTTQYVLSPVLTKRSVHMHRNRRNRQNIFTTSVLMMIISRAVTYFIATLLEWTLFDEKLRKNDENFINLPRNCLMLRKLHLNDKQLIVPSIFVKMNVKSLVVNKKLESKMWKVTRPLWRWVAKRQTTVFGACSPFRTHIPSISHHCGRSLVANWSIPIVYVFDFLILITRENLT